MPFRLLRIQPGSGTKKRIQKPGAKDCNQSNDAGRSQWIEADADEVGYHATENRVSVHDLHATTLHQLGIDHSTFTYKFQGLGSRLTGVEASQVFGDLLA